MYVAAFQLWQEKIHQTIYGNQYSSKRIHWVLPESNHLIIWLYNGSAALLNLHNLHVHKWEKVSTHGLLRLPGTFNLLRLVATTSDSGVETPFQNRNSSPIFSCNSVVRIISVACCRLAISDCTQRHAISYLVCYSIVHEIESLICMRMLLSLAWTNASAIGLVVSFIYPWFRDYTIRFMIISDCYVILVQGGHGELNNFESVQLASNRHILA